MKILQTNTGKIKKKDDIDLSSNLILLRILYLLKLIKFLKHTYKLYAKIIEKIKFK